MPDDWLLLTPEDLDVPAAIAFVTTPAAGGVATFLGTTRTETNPQNQPLLALDYEAYPEMARAQLADLAKRARKRWPVQNLAIHHRTGRVPPGHPSVLIAVSCPHRAAAFDACRFLIDTLKAELAVWKKEVWTAGPATWVHPEK